MGLITLLIRHEFLVLKRYSYLFRYQFRWLLFEIFQLFNDYKEDVKNKVETIGVCKPKKNTHKDGLPYGATHYIHLEKIFENNQFKFRNNDVFIDFGSGKGRVLFFVSRFKIRKIIGIEVDEELVKISKKNLETFQSKNTPIQIVNEDACKFDLKEGTVFFFYNPFQYGTLKVVMSNIKKSLIKNPRKISIIYHNPNYYFDFLEYADWLGSSKKLTGSVYLWTNTKYT